MPSKAPLEKLPLVARKNLRDEWESKKADIEKRYSELLKESWTVEVNANAISAYGDGSTQNTPGTIITNYLESGLNKIKDYANKYGDDGVKELNTVASKHVITIQHDDSGKVNYNACDIHDGTLRILFNENYYGSYVSDSFTYLDQAVNNADQPADAPKLSFTARSSIQREWDPEVQAVEAKLAKITGIRDIKLNPNWEQVTTALRKAGKKPDEYENSLGSDTLKYYTKLAEKMVDLKFDSDDMLQEGFQEAVSSNEIAVRVKEPLVQSNYNEVQIENGILYIQSVPGYWASYQGDPANYLVDLL